MPTCSHGGYSPCAKPIIAVLAMLGLCLFMPSARADNATALTLQTAINLALENAPSLAEARSLEKAARADLAQAGRWQNPELGIEAENIFGNGEYKGADAAEVTVGLTQPFELPGKRKQRLAVAASAADLGHQQADIARVDVIHAVTVAYVEAAVARQTAVLMQGQLSLAESVYKSVARKVEAGKEPPFQERKAQIDLGKARLAAQRAAQQATMTRDALDLLTGVADGAALDAAFLGKVDAPPSAGEYMARVTEAPVLRGATAIVKTAEAEASYARAVWLPDPAITLGIRDMREDDSQAMVLGVSMPIPLADRNASGVIAAHARASAAVAAQRKTRQSLESEVLRLYAEMTAAHRDLGHYRADILPAAQSAADLTQRGYDAGKFQYIDMLDARRMLADSQQAENDALLTYHLRKADLERLAGAHDHPAAEAHP